MRANIRVAVQYIEAWISGNGCVPIYGLMEDAATAEISRTSIWQWIHHQKTLSNGKPVTKSLFRQMLAEEMRVIQDELGEHRFSSGRFDDAARLMEQITTSDDLIDFLTLPLPPACVNPPHNNMEHLHMKTRTQQIEELKKEWTQPRWEGIRRPYSAEEVVKLRGSVNPECTLAQNGAAKMWHLLHGGSKRATSTAGALTGGQALQQAKAGIEAIYLSGWQVAADANPPPACIRISRSIRQTRCRRWWIGSTTPSAVRIRSSGRQVLSQTIRALLTTSCRSSRMQKPVSAAC